MPDRPDELKEARKLFAEFEKSNNHTIKTRTFSDAIDILNDYVEENADSPELAFIENIKKSYTRILLRQLNDMKEIEIHDWVNYTTLTILKVKDEVTTILSENPILEKGYDDFISIWNKEVLKYLTNLPNTE